MGTWGTAIKSNDTSSDVYSDFFELYDEGEDPAEISEKLILENQDLVNNPDDSSNFWFALALALWETKSLDEKLHRRVMAIIESGQDLEVWRELDATESEIKKRSIALEKFLEKISIEKPKSKRRKKKKVRLPVFEKGTCLTFKLDNGNYGGAVVLAADGESNYGYNLIVSTRLNQPSRPTIKDFEKAKVLVASFGNWNNKPQITWYLPDHFEKQYSTLFEAVGEVEVFRSIINQESKLIYGYSGGWQHIIEPVNRQFKYEKDNGVTKSFPLTDLIGKKKWWRF